MASAQRPPQVLLTGVPGIGKTTLIKKLCQHFQEQGKEVSGFYTEEIRKTGRRIGFDVVTVANDRATLARISDGSSTNYQYKVGRYGVTLQAFENLALKSLTEKQDTALYVIDEVGKMELFSKKFEKCVKQLFDTSAVPIISTIPVAKGRPISFVEYLRTKQETVVYEVTAANRDHLLGDIIKEFT